MKIKDFVRLIRFSGVTLNPDLDSRWASLSLASKKAAFRLPTISLKKKPFWEASPEKRKELSVIPFGFLRAGQKNYLSQRGGCYAFVCLLVNNKNPNDDCMFGVLPAPSFCEKHVTRFAISLYEGYVFTVGIESDEQADTLLEYPSKPEYFPIRTCNLPKTCSSGSLVKNHYFVLNRQEGFLTKQQYVALEGFVRMFSTMTYGVDYNQFIPLEPELKDILRCVQTIPIESLQNWISSTLCEMLVHSSHVVRNFAKHCVELRESI